MRRIRLGLKILVLALLAAAIVNPTIEVGAKRRCRVYLVDRSQSVLSQQSSPSTLKPAEIVQLINYDMARLAPDDLVGLALFGRTVAFQFPPRPRGAEMPVVGELSAQVDPGSSNALQALQAIRLQMPSDVIREVVLFSDGNFDASLEGAASALGLNVYCIGVGDPKVRDVRIVHIEPPAVLREGQTFGIDVELESTVSGPVTVAAGDKSADLQLVAGARSVVRLDGFIARPSDRSMVVKATSKAFEDVCLDNNQVRIDLLFEQKQMKLLVISSENPSKIGQEMAHEYDVRVSKGFESPEEYHAVVLENAPAPGQSAMAALRNYVTALGGGVVVIGGPNAYRNFYYQTDLEELLPVNAYPDEHAVVAFVIDASGSMGQDFQGKPKMQWIRDAIMSSVARLNEADQIALVVCKGDKSWSTPLMAAKDRNEIQNKLKLIVPDGATHLLQQIQDGGRILSDARVTLQHMVLITDGEIAEQETLEEYERVGKQVKAGLSIFLTGEPKEQKRLSALGGTILTTDFADLGRRLEESTLTNRRLFAERVKILPQKHELTEGLAEFSAPWMNRVGLKKDATLLAKSEQGDPAAAIHRQGSGWAAAFAYAAHDGGLTARVIRHVTSRRQPARFTSVVDRDQLRIELHLTGGAPEGLGAAEGSYQHPRTGKAGGIRFVRKGAKHFEAVLERPDAGSYHIDVPDLQARGSIDIMYSPELARLGIDSRALREAGAVVSRLEEIREPAVQGVALMELRPWLAALALALLLVELILGAIWK